MIKRRFGYVLIIILLAIAALTGLFMRYPVKYIELIRKQETSLDTALICAVIHAESKFRPNARSHKDAAGLMQITENTATWMAAEMGMKNYDSHRIYEPEINIAIGCYFLDWLVDYYDGDISLALCAYNAGMGNVNRWLEDPRYSKDGQTLTHIPFPETEQYLQRVETNQKIYNILLFFTN